MIVSFKDEGTEDVFNGKSTKAARKTCPQSLWKVAARKLDQLDSVITLKELRIPPGNWLEALTGDPKGSTAFISMTGIVSVSYGRRLALIKWKSWIITEYQR